MSFAYPGQGRPLYLATYATGKPSQVTYPLDPIIPATGNDKVSDSEAMNDAFNTTITVVYDVVPAAATNIEYDSSPTFANAITLDTIPLSATDKVGVWTTKERLPGFIRVKNTSTVQINSVVVQKQVATVG